MVRRLERRAGAVATHQDSSDGPWLELVQAIAKKTTSALARTGPLSAELHQNVQRAVTYGLASLEGLSSDAELSVSDRNQLLQSVAEMNAVLNSLEETAAERREERDHHHNPSLTPFALSYEKDAGREHRAAWALLALALGLAVAAGWLGIRGIEAASGGPIFGVQRFLAHAAVAAIPILFCLAALLEAGRRRKQADEAHRLSRQLASFEAYAMQLPEDIRYSVQAAMVQRFFPRLLGDDDPLRESRWPDPKEFSVVRLP